VEIKLGSFFSLGGSAAAGPRDEAGFHRLELPAGGTVEDLVNSLNLLGEGVDPDDVMFFVYVNGRESTLDAVLNHGDTVDLHVPAMGG
jgi:molybdopterin converting factor small subunit